MADTDTDTDTGSEDQQTTGSGEDSKPENKRENGKSEGKGKDDKKPDDKKDDEQGRKDQFAEAASDPLADALGGPSARAGEGQAYRSWIRTVRASGAAAFVGGGNIGVLNITTASGSYDRRGQAPGPVRGEVITELISRYAPVVGYEMFVKQLSSTRLLVLRGAPGTGRTTTGLRLLAKVADSVARFSQDMDLRALTAADLEPQSGYLLELSPGSGSPRRRPLKWTGCATTSSSASAIWFSLRRTTSAIATVLMAASPTARCPTRRKFSARQLNTRSGSDPIRSRYCVRLLRMFNPMAPPDRRRRQKCSGS